MVILMPNSALSPPMPAFEHHQTHLSLTSPQIQLSCGKWLPPNAEWMPEPLWQGIKLILVLRGSLQCRLENQENITISSPTLCVIANHEENISHQRFTPDTSMHYASVRLDAEMLDSLEISDLPLLQRATQHGPQLLCQPASKPMQALVQQMITNPLQGKFRDLYLAGKALELSAFALEQLQGQHTPTNPPRLNQADIERIHQARELLAADLANAPTLYQLARQVGLNVRKLNHGFKMLLGCTVAACLQELRLQQGYRLLVSGDCPIANVAWSVGYTPAHFSTAFRKRFGLSPHTLRQ